MAATFMQTANTTQTSRLMKNRVAIVTGASRGMGAATAKLLAMHGAKVGVNYYNSAVPAQQVVEAITKEGGDALAVKADVTDKHQVEAMVQEVTQAFGVVDTLVINAASNFRMGSFIDSVWEDFEAKLLAELKSAYYPVKAVVSEMIKQKRGSIIAVSAGLSRSPMQGFGALTTAKSGLDGFMKTLALELGQFGIRVNMVAPGLTLTEASAFAPQEMKDASAMMTPLRRNAEAEDIASAILLLASNEARFITGAYLPVSGGMQML